jgi:hypothetical protein
MCDQTTPAQSAQSLVSLFEYLGEVTQPTGTQRPPTAVRYCSMHTRQQPCFCSCTTVIRSWVDLAGVSPVDLLPSVDILPELKYGDSFYKTLMSERENVLCGVYGAVVQCTALLTSPFSYSQTCSTFRTALA